jgi:capsular exopolysaccharide synthesis family protein
MALVRNDTLLTIVWRRRWLVLLFALAMTVTVAIGSKTLENVYTTSSKLLIVQSKDTQSFDAVQASQVAARTYSEVLSSPNIARIVARDLGDGVSTQDVENSISVEPVAETQLLEIQAEATTARGAKRLADTYAQVFIDYSKQSLTPTTSATVALADAAPVPGAPSRPRPLLYTLVAMLLSVPLAIGVALLRDRFDSRLRSPEEMEERLGLPVLARLPRRGRDQPSMTAFDEGFRFLRTALRFASPEEPVRSIAVSSSSEGEGKTTTSLNLAYAALEAGQRVLLVDADVYKGSLYERTVGAPGPRERLGLAHYLIGDATLKQVIHETDREGLRIIPAERLPQSLSGLLESTRGRNLGRDLAKQADLVIFDCPPVSAGADATAVAARADGVVLVVDLGVSTEHRLRQAMRQLTAVNARVLGALINRDRAFRPADYAYMRRSSVREPALPVEPEPAPPEPQPDRVKDPV